MASLDDLRADIDDIDKQIVALLARRLRVCADVAALKEQTGATVIQPDRVRRVLSSRRQWAIDEGVDADFAEHIFRTLLPETHRIEVADAHPVPAPSKSAGEINRSELDTVACRIDHVVVAVADIDAARHFFADMGFRIQATDDANVVTAEAGG
ncbi:MAG: chorismate mutase, partial [Actinomycetota bacterium]